MVQLFRHIMWHFSEGELQPYWSIDLETFSLEMEGQISNPVRTEIQDKLVALAPLE
jgi:hypothetical protein